MATDQGAVALAEFTAALSLAADQAAGLSLERGLRCCLLATRLARRAGLAAGELREVYYTALLRSVGCTSDAHEQAALFGDEIAARAELNLAPHLPVRELLGVLVRHSAAGEPPLRRAAAVGRTLAGSRDLPRQVAAAHCETAQRLSGRLSLPESVGGAARGVRALGRERVPGRPGRGTDPFADAVRPAQRHGRGACQQHMEALLRDAGPRAHPQARSAALL